LPTHWLQIYKSLKTPNDGENTFGHVCVGKMNNNGDVVIKVYKINDIMLKTELSILKNINRLGINNVVRVICHFGCSREVELAWTSKIKEPRVLCDESAKKDTLYFIVIEYLPHGNIYKWFSKSKNHLNNNTFVSFLQQCVLCLLEIYTRLGVHHGDIHSGNILIDFDRNKTNKYTILGKEYQVQTNGCEPIFIDFGRGNKSAGYQIDEINKEKHKKKNIGSEWIDEDDINWTIQEALLVVALLKTSTRIEEQKNICSFVYDELSKFDKTQFIECADFIANLSLSK
jgi:serine/threonine protein kinase